jgi:drug/metabolite transporter (DMT)-like permease
MQQAGLAWLAYAMVTVFAFGVYGNLLHAGQVNMGDAVNGRYKAFLFVGVAYFLVAVLAPVVILIFNGATWDLPMKGAGWSLIAGAAGAVGAFAILLAFGAKGTPAVVMSIVFAGAPIVNAIVSMAVSPPAGGMSSIRWQFVAGILLAAVGGYMVTLYKPPPGPHASAVQHSAAARPSPAAKSD